MKKVNYIPFLPFSIDKGLKRSRFLYGFARKFLVFAPNLKIHIHQTELDIKDFEYMALVLYTVLFMTGVVFAGLVWIFSLYQRALPDLQTFAIIIAFVGVLDIAIFFYLLAFPRLLTARKMRLLERDLLFAFRHLLIKVKSGIPLFNGRHDIAKGGYGEVSLEVRKIVKNITGGMHELEALSEAALVIPSLNFRRGLWQIVSTSRAGSDLANTLEVIVKNLAAEHRILLRKYGAELNPLAVMYIVASVIFPPLGIATLMIIANLFGVLINEMIFVFIFIFIIVFNIMFMGMIKTRRPMIEL